MNDAQPPDLYELAEMVDSKQSFIRFLDRMANDWHDSQEKEAQSPSSPYSANHNDWENPDLGRFLEAMVTWADTRYTVTGELNVPDEPSWNAFARLMAAAKVYE